MTRKDKEKILTTVNEKLQDMCAIERQFAVTLKERKAGMINTLYLIGVINAVESSEMLKKYNAG